MSTCKITKSFVDKVELPESGQAFYRDNLLKGFAVRVTVGGSKAFVLEKRINRKLKRITLGRYPEITVETARKEAQKYLGEIATGIDPIAKRQQAEAEQMTLWQVWQDYRRVKSNLKEKTYVQYEMYLNGKLADWKNKRLVDISKDMVAKRHAQLLSSHSPSYANTAMRVLSAIYKFAKGQYEDNSGNSLFPHNPVERLGQLNAWAREPRRQNVIKPHQLQAWYEALQDMKFNTGAESHHVAADYLLFLLLTGLRKNEAATLTWDNVDLEEGSIHIPDTKNKEPLTLPLSDVLISILNYRLRFRTNDYVFSSRKAKFLAYPEKALRYLTESSGIKFTFHDLRRTFITVAESLDISAYAIKRLVNHKNGSDVTEGYIIANHDRLRAPMQRITDFFKEQCNINLDDYVSR
ncbi:integrase family protein [Thalassotalea sp. M1531]|uniref:Integrase family protein n=1 Tax=Thalassotalea algicola TaxID=2716224 RepID=A0A7Y0LDI9_9GAMM|nr:integrase family protein [Thalassotalea algicola]NMP32563.1 integrase family protein [Thalassotalea algicola]